MFRSADETKSLTNVLNPAFNSTLDGIWPTTSLSGVLKRTAHFITYHYYVQLSGPSGGYDSSDATLLNLRMIQITSSY